MFCLNKMLTCHKLHFRCCFFIILTSDVISKNIQFKWLPIIWLYTEIILQSVSQSGNIVSNSIKTHMMKETRIKRLFKLVKLKWIYHLKHFKIVENSLKVILKNVDEFWCKFNRLSNFTKSKHCWNQVSRHAISNTMLIEIKCSSNHNINRLRKKFG